MDEQVQAVLEEYHARIREEKALRETQRDLRDSEGRDAVMRAVGPQTGQLLNILARSLDEPVIVELGTSFGYSGIWLAEAARATGGKVITMELDAHKSDHARQMAQKAGLADFIEFQTGDALKLIGALERNIDFVLVDLWKDLYEPCLDALYPKLNPGAIIVADNMIRPGSEDIRRYGRAVRSKPGITSIQLSVGSGIEVSRYQPVPAY